MDAEEFRAALVGFQEKLRAIEVSVDHQYRLAKVAGNAAATYEALLKKLLVVSPETSMAPEVRAALEYHNEIMLATVRAQDRERESLGLPSMEE